MTQMLAWQTGEFALLQLAILLSLSRNTDFSLFLKTNGLSSVFKLFSEKMLLFHALRNSMSGFLPIVLDGAMQWHMHIFPISQVCLIPFCSSFTVGWPCVRKCTGKIVISVVMNKIIFCKKSISCSTGSMLHFLKRGSVLALLVIKRIACFCLVTSGFKFVFVSLAHTLSPYTR